MARVKTKTIEIVSKDDGRVVRTFVTTEADHGATIEALRKKIGKKRFKLVAEE